MDESEKDKPESKEELEKKEEPKKPLFSDEVFKDDLELGKDDLDNLPV